MWISNLYFPPWGSLACNWVLSVSGQWVMKLNNALVIQDPESTIVNIFYGWPGTEGLCSFMFSFVT